MPYAIIEEGGKQYKVQEGDTIEIELREAAPGAEISFARVLLFHDGSALQVGRPVLQDVQVVGRVKDETKGPKVVAYKYSRRESYHRKVGHRQHYLAVQITRIGAAAGA